MKFLLICQIVALAFLKSVHADFEKIDTNGSYQPFPGVTVVASIQDETKDFWESVYKGLQGIKLITEHYSLLPVKSYHMTSMNLFTAQQKGSENWKNFIDSRLHWLQNLNATLEENGTPFQGKLVKPKATSMTIGFLVQIDPKQREQILSSARKFDSEKKIPGEFHVTLGYLYKETSKSIRQQIRVEIQRVLERSLKRYPGQKMFKKPKLCYFIDMTTFFPWDGALNPFK